MEKWDPATSVLLKIEGQSSYCTNHDEHYYHEQISPHCSSPKFYSHYKDVLVGSRYTFGTVTGPFTTVARNCTSTSTQKKYSVPVVYTVAFRYSTSTVLLPLLPDKCRCHTGPGLYHIYCTSYTSPGSQQNKVDREWGRMTSLYSYIALTLLHTKRYPIFLFVNQFQNLHFEYDHHKHTITIWQEKPNVVE
jgi:hypothetical protein